ncbi:hypothetical protein Q4511_05810 [Paracoccus sp. 1_MG-2023]|uniref:hypothetical protein n=1 Tax=unclassified Paracoccus (in: a-proteobacteria) TaxID=2688777 RepID=UPI001C09CC1E|nr:MULTISPECIES: hypothetical protein [unclassified Paracoccus (in: a-proteobacteria)]MBU2958306.1 hypothetical protein [Paracoccus sp. C2R09]MDO6668433.1 hypothetical protein [Paracoccus sp. 1_MG-2023]
MTPLRILTTAALLTASAVPALAERGYGNDQGRDHDRGRAEQRGHDTDRRHSDACPPGLAKKSPSCVPPGQAKKEWRRGENLRIQDYRRIDDPRRYRLEARPGWEYYRDGDRAYRVDRDTRRILAVLNLIEAF